MVPISATRRHLLLSLLAGVGVLAAPLAVFRASASADGLPEGPVRDAVRRLIGDATLAPSERVVLEVPETADNGNFVPFSVSVKSDMTDVDHVRSVHVFATASPDPRVLTARFSRLSGRAAVASRMRLARSQDIVALAELGSGEILMARRSINVTLGCCGG